MTTDILQSLDPRTLGKRLQAARRDRGFTQQDVADHLDVARTTVTAIEKGERRPRPEELTRLAELYGRSLNELLRQSPPVESFSVQLRAAPRPDLLSDVDITEFTSEFERLCDDYLELENLCGAPLVTRYPEPYLIEGIPPQDAGEDIADAERKRLGLGDGPLPNLREMLESDVGLRIFVIELPSHVSGVFTYMERLGGCIALNANHPVERQQMTLAHEYAHFLTNRYRPELTGLWRLYREPVMERFAGEFARAFLMPATALRRRFHDIRRGRTSGVTARDLMLLANHYGVSLEAMTLRLEEFRLVPVGTWDKLTLQGFKVGEARPLLGLPATTSNSEQLPRRYRQLAVEAFEQDYISEGQLTRFLRVSRVEARQIVEEMSVAEGLTDDGESAPIVLNFARKLS